jgi:hypothetical protein
MSDNQVPEQDWACEAYGPDMPGPRHCFVEALGRCASADECALVMDHERKRVFGRMQELAAENPDDPVWAELTAEFKSPNELLGGNEGDSVEP